MKKVNLVLIASARVTFSAILMVINIITIVKSVTQRGIMNRYGILMWWNK